MAAAADEARTRLEARLGVLTGREAALQHHLRGSDGRHEADFGDRANYTAADEVLEGIEEAVLEEVLAIRAALRRLDAGSWGVCAVCGEPIDTRRLEVLPHTATCTGCTA